MRDSSQWPVFRLLWPGPSRSNGRTGVGALRLRGQEGTVVRAVPGAIGMGLGLVRVDCEYWRAESADGEAIPNGSAVRITDVRGTRLVVTRLDVDSGGDGIGR